MARDANDIHRISGASGLRKVFDAAEVDRGGGEGSPVMTGPLETGSDNEIARCVAGLLRNAHGACVASEGILWSWTGTHWDALSEGEVFAHIECFDGAQYAVSDKRMQRYRLSEPRRKSISQLLYRHCLEEGFFDSPELGINCQSGFIQFGADGEPVRTPHDQAQRQRHVLDVDWDGAIVSSPPQDSLLYRLVEGCFGEDADGDEKQAMLAEIMACAVLGYSTRLAAPKAIVFHGPSAENGKSQWSELLRAVMPPDAVRDITPRFFSDRSMIPILSGALLNVSDELGAEAIHSEVFKQVVTGEPLTARAPYGQAFSFRCLALHVYAANELPPFSGGMDRGVRRRLLVLPFNRTIPMPERIPGLANLIARQEGSLVFAWMMAGAKRLIARGSFDPPESSLTALQQWIQIADPVSAFVEDTDVVRLTGNEADRVPAKEVYRAFCTWGRLEGLSAAQMPQQSLFTSRLKALNLPQLNIARHKSGNVVKGILLTGKRGNGVG